MLFHYVNPQGFILSKIPFGYGVNLFFVLSGFLITGILFKSKLHDPSNRLHDLGIFYTRRTLRIFPIYYITVIFLILIKFQNYKEISAWVLTYTTNIWIALEKPYPGSYNHLWSLAVEEQFYLFWPVLILWTPLKYIKYLIGAAILGAIAFKFGCYVHAGQWVPAMNASTLGCMDSLGLGALLAYIVLFKRSFYETYILNIWSFLGLLIIYFSIMVTPVFPEKRWIKDIFDNTVFSLLALFIMAPAVTDRYKGPIKYILENRAVVHIGKISYGIYLFHMFIPDFYNYLNSMGLFKNNTDTFRICFYFIACTLFAEITWRLIERPVLKLKSRFL